MAHVIKFTLVKRAGRLKNAECIDEHTRSFRLKNGKSNFANHFFDNPNDIYTDEFKMLHTADKGLKLNALKSLEINKRKFDDVLLNDQVDSNGSPLLNLLHSQSLIE